LFFTVTFPLQLKPWKLESDDTVLLDMLPFLEAVMTQHVPDVREVVKAYDGQDIPSAYR
jgi:import inner membrane translocase subunit TIM50